MGTNYYLESDVCPCCNRAKDALHIGKSSAGWCFALHVYEDVEDGPTNLEEWINIFSAIDTTIKNEYGDTVSIAEMITTICNRSHKRNNDINSVEPWWYDQNYAEPGPNGLTRSRVDGIHCIGHGSGTWDLRIGEFS